MSETTTTEDDEDNEDTLAECPLISSEVIQVQRGFFLHMN